MCDGTVRELLGERIDAALRASGVDVCNLDFAGEVTPGAVDAMARHARRAGCDCVIGIGGGKSIDAGKCVAVRLSAPFLSVPTAASTDAPASLGAAVYNEAHVRTGSERLKRHPELVLVDTAVIASAPARLLAAGIGDALSKKFEAQAAAAAGAGNYHGYVPTRFAMAIADTCYRTLREHGHAAFEDVEAGRTSAALEATVEAIIFMSPVAFENGGLSFAHSMQTALMQARGASRRMHGEHIAYALLVQLAMESRADQEITDLAGFLGPLGLPVSLADLDCPEPSEDELCSIAAITCAEKWAHHVPFPVDEAMIVAAMRRIEKLSDEWRGQ
ncbi:hypothetical protein NSU_3518 [Novosphingobium pentaromativorans US6-1]|uniref:Uncharacterized protein n=1 Tax=Novosphingobium pentaromativorans US6-1 TaxID=1088721 RepID=G6EGP7_9SPHN|nr:hypothetical protein NSU_3518 [Novosphingobium pentaromativorans US6-1]